MRRPSIQTAFVLWGVLVFGLVSGCADEPPTTDAPAYEAHEEASDFVPVGGDAQTKTGVGVSDTFDRHQIVAEDFFVNTEAVSGDAIQAFFEESPYGRSWLADARIGEERASDAIARESREAGINPILMLARMQVEKSLVSKAARPSQSSVDYAFGCGCPDGRSCSSAYRGLSKQVRCAADTLRGLHDDSTAGAGTWRKGSTRRSLDGRSVTPINDATAALYGYTPWVLEGRGGNWLVWNVVKRFTRHFEAMGLLNQGEGVAPLPFIGTLCERDEQCGFVLDGAQGFCHRFEAASGTHGFCTVLCEGYCPDRDGHAWTFCTKLDELPLCVSQSTQENDFCEALPGTAQQGAERYVGSSGASARQVQACLPAR